MIYIIIAVSVLCVLFSLITFLLFGREEKIFTNIQTEPPRDLNPLEVALVYNKRALPGDAVALLHYLASKDYLKITKTTEGGQIILTKLKNYDGNNAAEKIIFNDVFFTKDTVSIDDIKQDPNLNTCFRVAAQAANSEVNTDLYFSKFSSKMKSISMIVNFIGIILVNILVQVSDVSQIFYIIFTTPFIIAFIIFQGIGLYVGGSGGESEIGFGVNAKVSRGKNRTRNNIAICVFLMLFVSLFVIILIFTQNDTLSNIEKISLSISYIIGLTLICVSQQIARHIDKKTMLGMKLYQEITGFKEYLDKAERPMVEKLYIESPSVFRKIISYGFVLGISKKWTSDFDVAVFNSIFTTAFGNNDEDLSTDNKSEAEIQIIRQRFQEVIQKNRELLQYKINTFNELIIDNDLVLFGKIYKEPLKMPTNIFSK